MFLSTSIFDLHDFPMVYALNELSTVRGVFDFDDSVCIESLNNFLSSFKELVCAVRDKDYIQLRCGIANTLTKVLSIGFLLNMPIREKDLRDVYMTEAIFPREDYLCYVDDIYECAMDLQYAFMQKNMDHVKMHIVRILARLYLGLPEFSKFTIRDDLVAITASSLKKVFPSLGFDEVALINSKVFDEVSDEEIVWNCYLNMQFKALTLLNIEAA